MSGLLKPWTHTTNTINDGDPINVEFVGSVSQETVVNDNTQNGKSTFELTFHMHAAGLQPKDVTWRYASAVLRDADLATLLANNSVAL